MDTNNTTKPKRSIELSKKQLAYLNTVLNNHESKTAAGLKLGVSKDVLDRTLAFGSCSEKTYKTLFPGILEEKELEAA